MLSFAYPAASDPEVQLPVRHEDLIKNPQGRVREGKSRYSVVRAWRYAARCLVLVGWLERPSCVWNFRSGAAGASSKPFR